MRFFAAEADERQIPNPSRPPPPLSPPRQRSGQAEQSNKTKETFNNRRGHNTRTHLRRIVRQHSEADRLGTRIKPKANTKKDYIFRAIVR